MTSCWSAVASVESSFCWTNINSSLSKTSVVRFAMGKKSVAAEQKIFLIFDDEHSLHNIKIIYRIILGSSKLSSSVVPPKIFFLIFPFSFLTKFPWPTLPIPPDISSKPSFCTHCLFLIPFVLSGTKISLIFPSLLNRFRFFAITLYKWSLSSFPYHKKHFYTYFAQISKNCWYLFFLWYVWAFFSSIHIFFHSLKHFRSILCC